MGSSRVFFCAVAVFVAVLFAGGTAAVEVCSTDPPHTVTFVTTCKTIDVAEKACWKPLPPNADSVVLFPAGTSASVPVAASYVPLFAKSVIIAAGANVAMDGGGVQVGECFIVHGKLTLTGHADGGAVPTVPYKADPKSPVGTDCSYIKAGFTPRICGPGLVVAAAGSSVTVTGLYASIFAPLRVDANVAAVVGNAAFLWGNTSVMGTLSSPGSLYLHGYLYNHHVVFLDRLYTDYWHTFYVKPNPVIVYNGAGATMNITYYLITDIPSYAGRMYPTYRASLYNAGLLNLLSGNELWLKGTASTGVDMVNTGTVYWRGVSIYFSENRFDQIGTAVNKGVFIADNALVVINTYLSDGGKLETKNYGYFVTTPGLAGPDTHLVELCRRRRSTRTSPARIGLAANRSERSQPCGLASYNSYCGDGFSWEVDVDCMMSDGPIDRYEYETAMRHFSQPLPRFSRHRVEFRDGSRVGGAVTLGQAVGVRGTVVVERGATLRLLVEGGARPFEGDGVVVVEGVLQLGLRTSLASSGVAIVVAAGGSLVVPRACQVQVGRDSMLRVERGGEMVIDGQMLYVGGGEQRLELCGSMRGRGGILGDFDDVIPCPSGSG